MDAPIHGNFHGTSNKPWDFSVHRFQRRLEYNQNQVSFLLHPLDICGNQLAKWLAFPTTVKFPKWLVSGLVLENPSDILNGKGCLRNTQSQLMVVNKILPTRSWYSNAAERTNETGWLCWTHVINYYYTYYNPYFGTLAKPWPYHHFWRKNA